MSGAPPSNSLCNTLNPAEYQPPGNRKSKLNSAPPPKHNGDTLPPPPMAVSPSTFCSSPVLDRSLLHGGRSSSVFFTRPFLRPVFSNEAPLPRFSVSVRSQKIDELSGHGPAKSHFVENGSSSSVSSSIDFLTFCHRLKTTKRQGWVNHGINGAESIADHMYRMALMSLVVGDLPGVNRERCMKIAIVHDIAEAIVGDITPSDGVPKAEKSKLEQAALNEMCKMLGGGMRAEEIKELWYEYENNASVEANLVKDFDKVEMILQALEYETERGKVLDEFFISTAGKFQTELGKSWAAEIISRRKSQPGKQSIS
ncbi:5'-deoxynucleotidase HDDC2 [Linum perenne]